MIKGGVDPDKWSVIVLRVRRLACCTSNDAYAQYKYNDINIK